VTYRDRREAKAKNLRDWADKREQKAEQARARVHAIADNIPLGQPILVGHHSEAHARRDCERIQNGMRATVENSNKAAEFVSRADNIEHALDKSVYSDDPDAIEALQARIAANEKKRTLMKEG
jgi:DNA repair exonuclease SbcCD ATPase subunit